MSNRHGTVLALRLVALISMARKTRFSRPKQQTGNSSGFQGPGLWSLGAGGGGRARQSANGGGGWGARRGVRLGAWDGDVRRQGRLQDQAVVSHSSHVKAHEGVPTHYWGRSKLQRGRIPMNPHPNATRFFASECKNTWKKTLR